MSLDQTELQALGQLLSNNDDGLVIQGAHQLTGGASRQTYAVTADGGARNYILQREMSEEPRLPNGMADEASLVSAAKAAGVPAPNVVGTNADGPLNLGKSYFVTEAVPGETIARRILRDERFAAARAALPGQLGQALARLHCDVDPRSVGWLEPSDELTKYREIADELDLVSPAFELGFRWLADRAIPIDPAKRRVVHGDFRLGNLIIDEAGLAAVIDWELGHLGDPMEDLGWVCVRAWRFGGAAPVAGVGQYEQFFTAYEQASGIQVDHNAVRWWETLGTLKWGVMCATQSTRHLSGTNRSVELAAIGPRVAEQEYDVLRLIAPALIGRTLIGQALIGQTLIGQTLIGNAADDDPQPQQPAGEQNRATGLAEGGGRPSASELVEAVQAFLSEDVSNATEGRTRFHARVAANALATVQRELALGGHLAERGAVRLAAVGFDSERALAEAIRAGELDDRFEEISGAVYGSVVDRLHVNNPGWLVD